MADPDNFDDDELEGEGQPRVAFDPTAQAREAAMHFYAHTQANGQLKQFCARILPSDPSSIPLRFWHCFALSKLGEQEEAIRGLEPLAQERDCNLPAVALLLTAHNSKARKDKATLLELKSRLKVVSKQTSESSLLLAGRYFLYTGKAAKARQCIEKLLAKNKKDVALLAMFGWIYLQSGEEKYVEKAMQVFKKAAKLSLPNFDIAALLGRAKYFENEGNVPKAIQSLDSITKIYPTFLPSLEEKLRLLALSHRWSDMPPVVEQIRSRRRTVLGLETDSVGLCYSRAIQSFVSQSSTQLHAASARNLLEAVAREEKGNTYWIWQFCQLFTRMTRVPTSGSNGSTAGNLSHPVLSALFNALSPLASASAAQKGGSPANLQFESALLSFLRGDIETARQGFTHVSQAPLTVEKAEKGEEDEKGASGEAAGAGKVNEDERWQKAQAHCYLILIQLQQGQYDAARTALDAFPADLMSFSPTPSPSTPAPPSTPHPFLLSLRAALTYHHSRDASLAGRHLLDALTSHTLLTKDRSLVQGSLVSCNPNSLQAPNRLLNLLDPMGLLRMAGLFLEMVGVDQALTSSPRHAAITQARAHADLLAQLQAAFRHFTSILPGYFDAWKMLALLCWLAEDREGATAAAERCAALEEEGEERVQRLKRMVNSTPESPSKPTSSSSSVSSTPSNPLPISSTRAAPTTADRRDFRATMGEEFGLDLEEEEDEEDRALFKDAADEVDEAEARAAKERAEREAQALLDEMESRAGANAMRKKEEARQAEAIRLAREAERKRALEELHAVAEQETAAALVASRQEAKEVDAKTQAELRAQLQAERLAHRRGGSAVPARSTTEVLDTDEFEMTHQRRTNRFDTIFQGSGSHNGLVGVTRIQAFDGEEGSPREVDGEGEGEEEEVSPLDPLASPLSLQQSPHAQSGASPLSPPSVAFQQPAASPTSVNQASASPSSSQPHLQSSHPSQPQHQLTPEQLEHVRQLEQQRNEESRLMAEKKEKILQAGLQIEQAKKFTKVAFWGEVFIKHGRRGSPHERNVTLEVTGSELKFDWSSGQLKAHKNEIQLVEGKGTPVFQRSSADKAKPERCFSIVTEARTLDLEAMSDQAREYWVTGIKLLLKYLK